MKGVLKMETISKIKGRKKEKNKISFKRNLKIISKDWQLYSLLILPIIYYVIFKYGPMVGNIIAFRKYVPGGSMYGSEWIGFKYFKIFITDPTFWQVFKNTLMISGLSLIIGFPFPIIFALLLNELKGTRFKKFVLPYFLSTVVVAGMIMQLLSPSSGIINSVIKHFTGNTIDFLAKPEWFRTIYISSGIWQGLGWGAILYLASLSGISMELYEAAKIDGANRWKQTLHVTIPGILPTIVILLTLNIGGLLSVGYEKVLLLYNPLTYSTADVLSTYLYRMGLESNNFSYATAIGLFESIIGLILITIANKVSRKLSDTSLW
jgi:putative aldouronate transport system permease protein